MNASSFPGPQLMMSLKPSDAVGEMIPLWNILSSSGPPFKVSAPLDCPQQSSGASAAFILSPMIVSLP